MKFQINAFSPVRAVVASLRMTAAVHRVVANLGDLAARGVEAATSDEALKGLAGHLAEATAPLEAVLPRVGDREGRAAKIEVGLRRDIHGDVPEAPPAPPPAAVPCPGKSRGARRRAKARAAKAAVQAAPRSWTGERVEAYFIDAFPKA